MIARSIRWIGFIFVVTVFFVVFSIDSFSHQFGKFNWLFEKSSSSSFPELNRSILFNVTFSPNRIYHIDGIAYDFYSQDEWNRTNAGDQWKIWPLAHNGNDFPLLNVKISPQEISSLPLIEKIYVMTDPRLKDRHENLKKVFFRQGISIDSIEWRLKWNQTTCNDPSNRQYVYQRLNLNDKPLTAAQQRKCALAMKHADVWYEMAEKNISYALILEDDALFVPFFKEKFTRMVFEAFRTGIFRSNRSCAETTNNQRISNDEWKNQNPMIVIGCCFNFHGKTFESGSSRARPVFSPRKTNPSRCTHAYLLTSCSARALVQQIRWKKNDFWPSDFLQNYLFPPSPTLQSFWIDPPLSYQGNQVTDLDRIKTFRIQTYLSLR